MDKVERIQKRYKALEKAYEGYKIGDMSDLEPSIKKFCYEDLANEAEKLKSETKSIVLRNRITTLCTRCRTSKQKIEDILRGR